MPLFHRTAEPGALFCTAEKEEVFVRCCAAAMETLQFVSTFAVLSSPVIVHKASAIVDVDEAGTAGKEKDMYMRVAILDHAVMQFMQFLKHA